MLSFNEGKVCDAVVRHLEERAGTSRANLRWPENEGHPHPVEIAFMIKGNLFALEHTGIEPFKGHVQMDAEADRLFKPIIDALKNALGTTAVFELMIPANALQGRKMPEVRRIQRALIGWVQATAPTVPVRRYADYRKTSVGPPRFPACPLPFRCIASSRRWFLVITSSSRMWSRTATSSARIASVRPSNGNSRSLPAGSATQMRERSLYWKTTIFS